MQQFREEYRRILIAYLEGSIEWGRDALALGRKAVEHGYGIAELVALHCRTVVSAVLGSAELAQLQAEGSFFRPSSPNVKDPFERMSEFFSTVFAPVWEGQNRLLAEHCALIRLNDVREQEARRIGQALHDDSAQLLAGIHLAIDDVAKQLDSPHRERLQAIRTLLDQVEDQLRNISHELRPIALDDLGLMSALEFLGDAFFRRTRIPVVVRHNVPCRLPMTVETILYRTVQEALNNCEKHAQASHITVTVERRGGTIWCRVQDNGVGFDVRRATSDPSHSGLGLVGIRERIASLRGTVSIHSAPGHGTELLASVPSDAESIGACSTGCNRTGHQEVMRCV